MKDTSLTRPFVRRSLRRGVRPSTAPRLRGSGGGKDIWSAPPVQQFDEDLMTITSQTTRASKASGAFVEEDVDLVMSLEGLGADDLREAVLELRKFITQKLDKGVKQRVMDELNNNETVNYIKGLEEKKDLYQSSLREQALKLNNLRIAYESLQRRMIKSTQAGRKVVTGLGGSKGSRQRPQSAAISRTVQGSGNVGGW